MVRAFLSRSLIGVYDSSTAPLQGLQVISCFIIVMSHAFVLSPILLDSPLHFSEKITANTFGRVIYESVLVSAVAAVDIFFFISGFLLASNLHYRYLKETRRAYVYTALQYILSRWLRLIPIHSLIYFLMSFGSNSRCTGIGELSLLKIPNPNSLCVLGGWATQVDFQAHIIISLLFSCLPSVNIAESLAWMLTFLSTAFRIQKLLASGVPSLPFYPNILDYVGNKDELIEFSKLLKLPSSNFNPASPQHFERYRATLQYIPFYYFVEYRAAVLFIGVAVWFSMRYNSSFTRLIRAHPHSSCVFAVGCMLFHAAGILHWYHGFIFRIIYEGIGRILISIAVGIFVVLTCSVDRSNLPPPTWYLKWIQNVLGFRYFVFFARFSYVINMTQFFTSFILGTSYPEITKENCGSLRIIIAGLKWYTFTLMIGVPFCMFEEVCMIFRKRLLRFLFPTKDKIKDGKEN